MCFVFYPLFEGGVLCLQFVMLCGVCVHVLMVDVAIIGYVGCAYI